MRFSRPRRATRHRLAVLIPFAALLLAALPAPSIAQAPAKLLLQSVCILGTDQEYVAVYNPTASAVDLSNYYLTDALFTNQGYWFMPDATKRNSATSGGGTFNDWHVRFPAGAMIAAGDTVAVSVQGSAAFVRAYTRKPHFEVVAPGITDDAEVPTMREAFAGSVPASAGGTTAHGLTNSGESVSLYYWDQQSDLVVDIDYVVWADDSGSGTPQYRYFNIKTGVTVDGPDANTTASAYLADTPVASQSFIMPAEPTQAHTFGNAFRRESYTEGTQVATGGNGVGGRNETSENLATTWSKSNPAVPPFVKGGGPPPPALLTARAGGPYTGTVNQAISFNGSASTPATGETITGYSWNFGDSQSGSGVTPTHTYTTAGTFTVTLTVTGSGGGTNSATSTATVMSDVPPPPSSASKLLLQSVCILGTDQEYVAIYNPNATAVNLSNYYLTDALFTNQGYWNMPDPTKRNQASSGGGAFSDWHVRFPDGATIAAGDTIAVSVQGTDAYVRAYARKPHFEVVAPGLADDATVPSMREAFAGSVPPLAAGVSAHGLTNGGESISIYYWDQASDLVTDVDYFVWGNDSGSGTPQYRYFNIKTGVSIDGPDAGSTTSAYLADTPVTSQNFFPPADGTNGHAFGNAFRRESYTEGTQRTTGGNGVGGRDETSENMATTWSAGNLARPPFVKGSAPPPTGVLTARAGGPYSGTVNQPITFNGSASTPATDETITAYSWNFGDGQSGTGVNPQHTYTTEGTFTVTLTVTGSGGGTNTTMTRASITAGVLQLVARTFIPTIGETYPIVVDVGVNIWQFLRIFDLEGREVRVLLDEKKVLTVKKEVSWDGRDEELMLVAAGTYIAHLETRDQDGHIRSFTGPIVVARRLERN